MAMVIGWSGSIAQSACGQPFEVQLSIDSVNFFDNGNIITVSLKCKNFSNKNLLLYGFESDLNRYTDLARICNLDRVSARFALFVYDTTGAIQYPEWSIPDSIDYKPMPKARLDESMQKEQAQYRRATRIVKSNGTVTFERQIDLRDFKLRPGEYFLQFGYYSGKGIKQLGLDEAQIEMDEKANNAALYQGCTLSNKISFSVN